MTEFTIKDSIPVLLKLWQNKLIIAFITLAGLFAGLAYTAGSDIKVNYVATSSVCVTYTTYQEQMRGSSVITSYAGIVGSFLVCERAAELLEGAGVTAADIQRMTAYSIDSNSYVMYISATATEPRLAILVANAVAEAFTQKISSVSGNNSLQILDVAYMAEAVSKSPVNTILSAAAIPLVISCAVIAVKEISDGKIRLIAQCAEDEGEILGILPDMSQRWK